MVVKGTATRGGSCTTSGVVKGTGATTTITVRQEVAFNPATCETEYLVAELSPAKAAQYAALTESPTASLSGATNRTVGLAAARKAATHNRWVRTAWVDPINIDISSNKTALQWNAGTWTKRQVARNSFKGCISGVCLDNTYITGKANYYGNYSDRFEFSGVTDFRNDSFARWVVAFIGAAGWGACGFPLNSTATFHHDEQVVGYKNGGWRVNWKDSKNGACTNLVHHDSTNGGNWPF